MCTRYRNVVRFAARLEEPWEHADDLPELCVFVAPELLQRYLNPMLNSKPWELAEDLPERCVFVAPGLLPRYLQLNPKLNPTLNPKP